MLEHAHVGIPERQHPEDSPARQQGRQCAPEHARQPARAACPPRFQARPPPGWATAPPSASPQAAKWGFSKPGLP